MGAQEHHVGVTYVLQRFHQTPDSGYPPLPLDHLEAARARRGNDFLAVRLRSAARDQQRAP